MNSSSQSYLYTGKPVFGSMIGSPLASVPAGKFPNPPTNDISALFGTTRVENTLLLIVSTLFFISQNKSPSSTNVKERNGEIIEAITIGNK